MINISKLENNAENLFIIFLFSYPFFAALNLFIKFQNIYFSTIKYIIFYLVLLLFIKKFSFKLNFLKSFFLLYLFLFFVLIWLSYSEIIFIKFLISTFFICLISIFLKFELSKINFNKISLILFSFILFFLIKLLFNFEFTHQIRNFFYKDIVVIRVGSFNLNPISLCMYCLITVFFFERSTLKFKEIFQFILIFIALITGSRGPFIGFFFSIILTSLIFIKKINYYFIIKSLLLIFASSLLNMLYIIINKNLLLTNFYFSDALLRFLNMFVEKYSDKADTFRYDIFNHFVLGQKNIDVSLYDLKGETFYHNIFIESYKLFPPFFLLLLLIIACTYLISLSKNFRKEKNNILLVFMFNFFLINSFYSGFLPRDEFLFISISLIFSQTKIYSLIPRIKKFLK
jgi:hypothetical protein